MDRKVKVTVNIPGKEPVSWLTDASGKRELVMTNKTINMKTKDVLVEEALNILERFNFEKVHAYMTLQKWKVDGEIPTITKMRERSLTLLETVISRCLTDEVKGMKAEIDLDYGLAAIIEGDGAMLNLGFYIEHRNGVGI